MFWSVTLALATHEGILLGTFTAGVMHWFWLFSTTRCPLQHSWHNLVTHACKQKPGVQLHSMEVAYHGLRQRGLVSTWYVGDTGFRSFLPWSANYRCLNGITIIFCIISKQTYKLIFIRYVIIFVSSIYSLIWGLIDWFPAILGDRSGFGVVSTMRRPNHISHKAVLHENCHSSPANRIVYLHPNCVTPMSMHCMLGEFV